MELGQKIKTARLELGLSQRQLCGDTITRNMLSQIENGSARPSMDTLAILAERLGKTVSFFLEEHPASPNQEVMERARLAFAQKDYAAVQKVLEQYKDDDPVFDWEAAALRAMTLLELAKAAAAEEKKPYALSLLAEAKTAGERSPYFDGGKAEIELGKLGQKALLPDIDEVLRLKAQRALDSGDGGKAAALLDAMDSRDGGEWLFLRGRAMMLNGNWEAAKEMLLAAEADYPAQSAALLEKCFSELEDYRMAYFYACKQKNG